MLFVIEREFVLDLFILLAGILGEPFVTSAISWRVMFVGFFVRVWLLGMIFAPVSFLWCCVDDSGPQRMSDDAPLRGAKRPSLTK
jgi:hypothetical protein